MWPHSRPRGRHCPAPFDPQPRAQDHPRGDHREQATQRCSGTYQSATGQTRTKGEGQTNQCQERVREDRPASTWGSVKDGVLLRPQARRTRSPHSQPELRYLKSTPCQAALPSAPIVTFHFAQPVTFLNGRYTPAHGCPLPPTATLVRKQ